MFTPSGSSALLLGLLADLIFLTFSVLCKGRVLPWQGFASDFTAMIPGWTLEYWYFVNLILLAFSISCEREHLPIKTYRFNYFYGYVCYQARPCTTLQIRSFFILVSQAVERYWGSAPGFFLALLLGIYSTELIIFCLEGVHAKETICPSQLLHLII